jgi:transcriptional regulator with XRE-family HTH domain
VDTTAVEPRTPMESSHLRVVAPPAGPESSPLGAARVRRRLTIEEAAARAGLSVEDVRCLEESRIYRFPSVDQALAATLVYASALGISEREARTLAGLPRGPRVGWSLRRWTALAAFVAALGSLVWFAVLPELRGAEERSAAAVAEHTLPPPWEIRVDVFNGTEVPNAATQLANEVGGPLAYRVGTVENAARLDYVQTRVYYPPGSAEVAERLADDLGVPTQALPSGEDPLRLIVIVGRDRASGG